MVELQISSLDCSYNTLLSKMPDDIRAFATKLPFELGITKVETGRWSDFIQYLPNADLPVLAAEKAFVPGVFTLKEEVIEQFRSSHHLGVFYGVLIDRILDRQVILTESLDQTRQFLLYHWLIAFADATGDKANPTLPIRKALKRLKSSVKQEQDIPKTGFISPEGYLQLIKSKLYWTGISAYHLLLCQKEYKRYRYFREAYESFLTALQCLDDSKDAFEDEMLTGVCYPKLLGLSPSGLAMVALIFAEVALKIALKGGFISFAAWLKTFLNSLKNDFQNREIRPNDHEVYSTFKELGDSMLIT